MQPQGGTFSGQVNAQGRGAAGGPESDWLARGLTFTQAGGGEAKDLTSLRPPAPAPEPAPELAGASGH